MRVERLELSGIGPFDDAVFDFGPAPEGDGELVLFEGPNGSGKTTVLQAIAGAIASGGNRSGLLGALHGQFGTRAQEKFAVSAHVAHEGRQFPVAYTSPSETRGSVTPPLAEGNAGLTWAAFAFASHRQTPVASSAGPRDLRIDHLGGALSFVDNGASPGWESPSRAFGQLLTNIRYDLLQADYDSRRVPARSEELLQAASSGQATIDRIEAALTRVLGRKVTFEFPVGQHGPAALFDGEPVPIDALGEGLRSTFAWIADLLVRLEFLKWADTSRSPFDQEICLLLDEVDQSLHPQAQVRLLPALRELFPRARIYAATHSPFVVASVSKGIVFPIRPAGDHRVRGNVAAVQLKPGRTLDLVAETIFVAPTGFVDPESREKLEAHKREVASIARGRSIDWTIFLGRRRDLLAMGEPMATAVALSEIDVADQVGAALSGAQPPSAHSP